MGGGDGGGLGAPAVPQPLINQIMQVIIAIHFFCCPSPVSCRSWPDLASLSIIFRRACSRFSRSSDFGFSHLLIDVSREIRIVASKRTIDKRLCGNDRGFNIEEVC